ncbi:MAG: 1,4-alpha-glucan branching enzyme, partial [Gemmatimonadetes bacterium]|nr:1,4-alpha-glucan branching enzyme [Gemmatimonadota bacterium]
MIVHPERTLLTEQDLHLFNEGTHRRLYERLGGRLVALGPDAEGAHFAVWAPNAEAVSVVGDFNDWRVDDAPLEALGSSGIWAGLDERARPGHRYKFHIRSRHGGYSVAKADPFALSAETPPATASVLSRLDHEWGDAEWMARRARHNAADAPISIYEVHLGSWRRPDDPDREFLSYREMAEPLAQYATELGFSHVELLPVMEHPFYG